MTVWTLIRTELARLWATPLARLALVALMTVPILYGGAYLWANRDPYAGLDRVPAALVVQDRGATVDGKAVHYGRDVAKDVLAAADFDWHEVTSARAAAGVRDGRYDFSITLPAGFSADLVSSDVSGDRTPTRARLELVTDDTNSYLSSTIATEAADSIRSSIAKQVGTRAAKRLLVGLADVRDRLSTAADGAGRLASGARSAQSGAQQLADGTASVASGAQQLAEGTASLASGSGQLATGTARLATAGDQAAAAGQQLAAQLPALEQQLSQQLATLGLTPEQIQQVLARLAPLGTQATTAAQQLGALSAQVDALNSGAQQLASGATSAHSGATRLASGAQAANGGAASLASGLGTLSDGATQLQSGLASGVQQLPATTAKQRAASADTIGDPVAVHRHAIAEAEDYGLGLAPFFVSLAAWIGIYALFLIVKPISRRALTAVDKPVRVTLAGWLTPGLLGVVQMAAVFAILTLALGFHLAAPLATFGMMALASLTFAGMLMALNVLLGSVGQFLGLVLMVLQLVTAGGTFPWQTLPAPLAALHQALPMSYAVDALRQLMYGGSTMTAVNDALVLGAWLVGSLLVTTLIATRMTRRRTLRDLRPSLIG